MINEDASGENDSRNTITSASSSSNKINKQGNPPSKKNTKKKGKKRQYREAQQNEDIDSSHPTQVEEEDFKLKKSNAVEQKLFECAPINLFGGSSSSSSNLNINNN